MGTKVVSTEQARQGLDPSRGSSGWEEKMVNRPHSIIMQVITPKYNPLPLFLFKCWCSKEMDKMFFFLKSIVNKTKVASVKLLNSTT